ncbi:MAG: hypothetical protein HPM95_06835 [Alphaproteobacteria bacterium]|nr:hypothetical protein [Alphaproteobacteria bacterium]
MLAFDRGSNTQSFFTPVIFRKVVDGVPMSGKLSPAQITLTLSMIEAADPVDSGRIWCKRRINVPKTALYDEINASIFQNTLELIDQAILDPLVFQSKNKIRE